MKRFTLPGLLLIGMVLLLVQEVAAQPSPDSTLDRLLAGPLDRLKATPTEMRFYPDPAESVAFLQPLMARLLRDPLALSQVGDSLGQALTGKDVTPGGLLALAASTLDKPLKTADFPALQDLPWNKRPGLPPQICQALDAIYTAEMRSRNLIDSAFAAIPPGELDSFRRAAANLLVRETEDAGDNVDRQDSLQRATQRMNEWFTRLAAKVDQGALLQAGWNVARAVGRATNLLMEIPAGTIYPKAPGDRFPPGLSGDVAFAAETPLGWVIVGGPGPTVYGDPCALIIDPGGDDSYPLGTAATSPERPFSVTVDLVGDDSYEGIRPYSLASGFFGVAILADLVGDDIYNAHDFALGHGTFGVGLLWDNGGNDLYLSEIAGQGSGVFGLGILWDGAGNDLYRAGLYSQGCGYTGGMGILADRQGNDRYLIQPELFDAKAENPVPLPGMSQGFGCGRKSDWAGGIGILADGAGRDLYSAGRMAQGSAYWYGVGILWDRAGEDVYLADEYAQGCGVHFAAGLLLDREGNDRLLATRYAQGCGFDQAVGILENRDGNDVYTCDELAQGVGLANGMGILLDRRGDDSYAARSPLTTLGYGELRRDAPSYGVFLDLSGSDLYTVRGRDSAAWNGSVLGLGWDRK